MSRRPLGASFRVACLDCDGTGEACTPWEDSPTGEAGDECPACDGRGSIEVERADYIAEAGLYFEEDRLLRAAGEQHGCDEYEDEWGAK